MKIPETEYIAWQHWYSTDPRPGRWSKRHRREHRSEKALCGVDIPNYAADYDQWGDGTCVRCERIHRTRTEHA